MFFSSFTIHLFLFRLTVVVQPSSCRDIRAPSSRRPIRGHETGQDRLFAVQITRSALRYPRPPGIGQYDVTRVHERYRGADLPICRFNWAQ